MEPTYTTVINSTSSGLYVLRNLFEIFSIARLLKVYHALIKFHIAFVIELSGATSIKHFESILILIKRAIRIIQTNFIYIRRNCKAFNFF